jgi:anti-sigma B factor antagonist
MPTANLTTAVRRIGDTSLIDLKGEVTGFAENLLMDAYSEASANGARAIILNFSELEYLNSSGIGLLVTMLIRTQRQKQKLIACGLSDHYVEIFKLTRLDEAIGIFATETESLAAARA